MLVESWSMRWDYVDNPHGCNAWNRLALDFISPAKEGQKLSPTCCIEYVADVRYQAQTSHLAVVCHKPTT